MRTRYTWLVVAVVLVHLAVNLAHGWAHATIPVPTSAVQNAFIFPVIGVAPLVAALLALVGRTRAGAWLLAASMVGSLVFGVVYHYVIDSPDHVSRLPADTAGGVFRTSAFVLAASELAGFLIGLWGVRDPARREAAANTSSA